MALNTFEVQYPDGKISRMGHNELFFEFGDNRETRIMLGARASDIPARTKVAISTGDVEIRYTPIYMETTFVLYRFTFNVRRMGTLEGVFVSTKEEVDTFIGETAYFGEALGKHSQIDCELKPEQFEVVSTDQAFIKKLVGIMTNTVSGYNPIERIKEHREEMAWADG